MKRWLRRPWPRGEGPLPTIRQELLTSVMVLVFLSLALLSVVTGGMIEVGLESNINRILDTALQVAVAVYDGEAERLAAEVEGYLRAAPADFSPTVGDAQSCLDAALLYSPQGQLLAMAGLSDPAAVPPPPAILGELAQEAAALGTPVVSSELVNRSWLKQVAPTWPARMLTGAPHVPDYIRRLQETQLPVLVQVVAHPGPGATPAGAPGSGSAGRTAQQVVVGIHVVEGDYDLAQAYARRVPESFISISTEGIRLVSTIRTGEGLIEPGSHQQQSLVEAIAAGRHYYGRVRFPTGEEHRVVAAPIASRHGRVVGALAVGLPPAGFVPTRNTAFAALAASFLLCFGLSAIFVGHLSRRLTAPIVWLRDHVNEMSRSGTEGIPQSLLDRLDHPDQVPRTQEVNSLMVAFADMAHSLERKRRETAAYLTELKSEHQKLQWLTERLNNANHELEGKVAERTRELQEAVTELREANRQKSRFLASISHELRTPLNSIIGFSEMLRDELFGPLNEKQKQYVEIVLTSANHLLQIIADILDLSRIDQGRIELSMEEVSINDLVASVVAVLDHQVEAAELDLLVNVPRTLPRIWADPTRVKQVLYNLLSNAIKFTPKRGRVTIRAFLDAGWMVVEVEDTGIGIPLEDQERVFQEFAQVEEGYRRRFEGVGLGLPLCRKLVELHGGRIELKSQLGKGTTVTFSLPLGYNPPSGGEDDAEGPGC